MRLLATCASTIPVLANSHHPTLTSPGCSHHARIPAISAAVTVIGRTAARVNTNQREAVSTRPEGVCGVRNAYAQLRTRLDRRGGALAARAGSVDRRGGGRAPAVVHPRVLHA